MENRVIWKFKNNFYNFLFGYFFHSGIWKFPHGLNFSLGKIFHQRTKTSKLFPEKNPPKYQASPSYKIFYNQTNKKTQLTLTTERKLYFFHCLQWKKKIGEMIYKVFFLCFCKSVSSGSYDFDCNLLITAIFHEFQILGEI